MILLAVTAPALIPLLFGERWGASVPAAQALAVAGIITLGAMVDHGLFYGLGRPGAWLAYAVVVDAVSVTTTVVAVRWGLVGVAMGFVVVAVLATALRWVLVGRLLGLPTTAVARPFGTVLVPTAISGLVGLVAMRALGGMGSPVAQVAVCALAVVLTHLALLRALGPGILRDALSILPVPHRIARRARSVLRTERRRDRVSHNGNERDSP